MTAMRHPDDLMRLYSGASATLPQGCVMFCGTLAVKGAIEPAEVRVAALGGPSNGNHVLPLSPNQMGWW